MLPLDRIRKAHVAIMNHKDLCEFSGVLGCGKVRITTDVATAATDGWDVSYNPEFMDKHLRDDKHLRFVVLHENMHKAYRHMHVWRHLHEENAKLANIAADHFINLALTLADEQCVFMQVPEIGIQPELRFKGMSVQQIYNILKQEDNGDDDDAGGFDEHDWSGGDQDGDEQAQQQQEAQRATEIQRALQQGQIVRQKRQGDGAGKLSGVLGEAAMPKVDWRQVLRDFVTSTCKARDDYSWQRPNRRFLSQDLLMPGFIGEAMEELVVGFDTSGSVWGTGELDQFVAELTRIIEDVHPNKVHVIYWDSAVAGHQTFEDGQFAVQNLNVKGGGGTDGSVLFDYLRKHRIAPSAIVQFTDGFVGDWGNTDVPTLWVVTSNRKAPFGTTVTLDV